MSVTARLQICHFPPTFLITEESRREERQRARRVATQRLVNLVDEAVSVSLTRQRGTPQGGVEGHRESVGSRWSRFAFGRSLSAVPWWGLFNGCVYHGSSERLLFFLSPTVGCFLKEEITPLSESLKFSQLVLCRGSEANPKTHEFHHRGTISTSMACSLAWRLCCET